MKYIIEDENGDEYYRCKIRPWFPSHNTHARALDKNVKKSPYYYNTIWTGFGSTVECKIWIAVRRLEFINKELQRCQTHIDDKGPTFTSTVNYFTKRKKEFQDQIPKTQKFLEQKMGKHPEFFL